MEEPQSSRDEIFDKIGTDAKTTAVEEDPSKELVKAIEVPETSNLGEFTDKIHPQASGFTADDNVGQLRSPSSRSEILIADESLPKESEKKQLDEKRILAVDSENPIKTILESSVEPNQQNNVNSVTKDEEDKTQSEEISNSSSAHNVDVKDDIPEHKENSSTEIADIKPEDIETDKETSPLEVEDKNDHIKSDENVAKNCLSIQDEKEDEKLPSLARQASEEGMNIATSVNDDNPEDSNLNKRIEEDDKNLNLTHQDLEEGTSIATRADDDDYTNLNKAEETQRLKCEKPGQETSPSKEVETIDSFETDLEKKEDKVASEPIESAADANLTVSEDQRSQGGNLKKESLEEDEAPFDEIKTIEKPENENSSEGDQYVQQSEVETQENPNDEEKVDVTKEDKPSDVPVLLPCEEKIQAMPEKTTANEIIEANEVVLNEQNDEAAEKSFTDDKKDAEKKNIEESVGFAVEASEGGNNETEVPVSESKPQDNLRVSDGESQVPENSQEYPEQDLQVQKSQQQGETQELNTDENNNLVESQQLREETCQPNETVLLNEILDHDVNDTSHSGSSTGVLDVPNECSPDGVIHREETLKGSGVEDSLNEVVNEKAIEHSIPEKEEPIIEEASFTTTATSGGHVSTGENNENVRSLEGSNEEHDEGETGTLQENIEEMTEKNAEGVIEPAATDDDQSVHLQSEAPIAEDSLTEDIKNEQIVKSLPLAPNVYTKSVTDSDNPTEPNLETSVEEDKQSREFSGAMVEETINEVGERSKHSGTLVAETVDGDAEKKEDFSDQISDDKIQSQTHVDTIQSETKELHDQPKFDENEGTVKSEDKEKDGKLSNTTNEALEKSMTNVTTAAKIDEDSPHESYSNEWNERTLALEEQAKEMVKDEEASATIIDDQSNEAPENDTLAEAREDAAREIEKSIVDDKQHEGDYKLNSENKLENVDAKVNDTEKEGSVASSPMDERNYGESNETPETNIMSKEDQMSMLDGETINDDIHVGASKPQNEAFNTLPLDQDLRTTASTQVTESSCSAGEEKSELIPKTIEAKEGMAVDKLGEQCETESEEQINEDSSKEQYPIAEVQEEKKIPDEIVQREIPLQVSQDEQKLSITAPIEHIAEGDSVDESISHPNSAEAEKEASIDAIEISDYKHNEQTQDDGHQYDDQLTLQSENGIEGQGAVENDNNVKLAKDESPSENIHIENASTSAQDSIEMKDVYSISDPEETTFQAEEPAGSKEPLDQEHGSAAVTSQTSDNVFTSKEDRVVQDASDMADQHNTISDPDEKQSNETTPIEVIESNNIETYIEGYPEEHLTDATEETGEKESSGHKELIEDCLVEKEQSNDADIEAGGSGSVGYELTADHSVEKEQDDEVSTDAGRSGSMKQEALLTETEENLSKQTLLVEGMKDIVASHSVTEDKQIPGQTTEEIKVLNMEEKEPNSFTDSSDTTMVDEKCSTGYEDENHHPEEHPIELTKESEDKAHVSVEQPIQASEATVEPRESGSIICKVPEYHLGEKEESLNKLTTASEATQSQEASSPIEEFEDQQLAGQVADVTTELDQDVKLIRTSSDNVVEDSTNNKEDEDGKGDSTEVAETGTMEAQEETKVKGYSEEDKIDASEVLTDAGNRDLPKDEEINQLHSMRHEELVEPSIEKERNLSEQTTPTEVESIQEELAPQTVTEDEQLRGPTIDDTEELNTQEKEQNPIPTSSDTATKGTFTSNEDEEKKGDLDAVDGTGYIADEDEKHGDEEIPIKLEKSNENDVVLEGKHEEQKHAGKETMEGGESDSVNYEKAPEHPFIEEDEIMSKQKITPEATDTQETSSQKRMTEDQQLEGHAADDNVKKELNALARTSEIALEDFTGKEENDDNKGADGAGLKGVEEENQSTILTETNEHETIVEGCPEEEQIHASEVSLDAGESGSRSYDELDQHPSMETKHVSSKQLAEVDGTGYMADEDEKLGDENQPIKLTESNENGAVLEGQHEEQHKHASKVTMEGDGKSGLVSSEEVPENPFIENDETLSKQTTTSEATDNQETFSPTRVIEDQQREGHDTDVDVKKELNVISMTCDTALEDFTDKKENDDNQGVDGGGLMGVEDEKQSILSKERNEPETIIEGCSEEKQIDASDAGESVARSYDELGQQPSIATQQASGKQLTEVDKMNGQETLIEDKVTEDQQLTQHATEVTSELGQGENEPNLVAAKAKTTLEDSVSKREDGENKDKLVEEDTIETMGDEDGKNGDKEQSIKLAETNLDGTITEDHPQEKQGCASDSTQEAGDIGLMKAKEFVNHQEDIEQAPSESTNSQDAHTLERATENLQPVEGITNDTTELDKAEKEQNVNITSSETALRSFSNKEDEEREEATAAADDIGSMGDEVERSDDKESKSSTERCIHGTTAETYQAKHTEGPNEVARLEGNVDPLAREVTTESHLREKELSDEPIVAFTVTQDILEKKEDSINVSNDEEECTGPEKPQVKNDNQMLDGDVKFDLPEKLELNLDKNDKQDYEGANASRQGEHRGEREDQEDKDFVLTTRETSIEPTAAPNEAESCIFQDSEIQGISQHPVENEAGSGKEVARDVIEQKETAPNSEAPEEIILHSKLQADETRDASGNDGLHIIKEEPTSGSHIQNIAREEILEEPELPGISDDTEELKASESSDIHLSPENIMNDADHSEQDSKGSDDACDLLNPDKKIEEAEAPIKSTYQVEIKDSATEPVDIVETTSTSDTIKQEGLTKDVDDQIKTIDEPTNVTTSPPVETSDEEVSGIGKNELVEEKVKEVIELSKEDESSNIDSSLDEPSLKGGFQVTASDIEQPQEQSSIQEVSHREMPPMEKWKDERVFGETAKSHFPEPDLESNEDSPSENKSIDLKGEKEIDEVAERSESSNPVDKTNFDTITDADEIRTTILDSVHPKHEPTCQIPGMTEQNDLSREISTDEEKHDKGSASLLEEKILTDEEAGVKKELDSKEENNEDSATEQIDKEAETTLTSDTLQKEYSTKDEDDAIKIKDEPTTVTTSPPVKTDEEEVTGTSKNELVEEEVKEVIELPKEDNTLNYDSNLDKPSFEGGGFQVTESDLENPTEESTNVEVSPTEVPLMEKWKDETGEAATPYVLEPNSKENDDVLTENKSDKLKEEKEFDLNIDTKGQEGEENEVAKLSERNLDTITNADETRAAIVKARIFDSSLEAVNPKHEPTCQVPETTKQDDLSREILLDDEKDTNDSASFLEDGNFKDEDDGLKKEIDLRVENAEVSNANLDSTETQIGHRGNIEDNEEVGKAAEASTSAAEAKVDEATFADDTRTETHISEESTPKEDESSLASVWGSSRSTQKEEVKHNNEAEIVDKDFELNETKSQAQEAEETVADEKVDETALASKASLESPTIETIISDGLPEARKLQSDDTSSVLDHETIQDVSKKEEDEQVRMIKEEQPQLILENADTSSNNIESATSADHLMETTKEKEVKENLQEASQLESEMASHETLAADETKSESTTVDTNGSDDFVHVGKPEDEDNGSFSGSLSPQDEPMEPTDTIKDITSEVLVEKPVHEDKKEDLEKDEEQDINAGNANSEVINGDAKSPSAGVVERKHETAYTDKGWSGLSPPLEESNLVVSNEEIKTKGEPYSSTSDPETNDTVDLTRQLQEEEGVKDDSAVIPEEKSNKEKDDEENVVHHEKVDKEASIADYDRITEAKISEEEAQGLPHSVNQTPHLEGQDNGGKPYSKSLEEKLTEEDDQLENTDENVGKLNPDPVLVTSDARETSLTAKDEEENKVPADADADVEEKTDEEKEHEHREEEPEVDAPVMVETSREVNTKPSPKKSHNLLSGVGSKVKHSISKVKKAITGKSSPSKSPAHKSG